MCYNCYRKIKGDLKMYLFEQSDIREKIENVISEKKYSIKELKSIVFDFLNTLDEEHKNCVLGFIGMADVIMPKIIEDNVSPFISIDDDRYICEEDTDKVLQFIQNLFDTTAICDDVKREFLTELIGEFARMSDSENCCENKVFVVIKNFADEEGIFLVNEYDSWEAAEADIDDTYIGCCDDAYLAENMWFKILCYIQSREWDTLVNFCSVVEFDASGIEDGREYWEEENCDNEDEEYEEDDE